MISEIDLINFKESMSELSGDELQDYSIDLINYIEDTNLKIEDYRDLHFYSAFLGILNENNKLKEEYRRVKETDEKNESDVIINENTILNEASAPKSKRQKITNKVLKIMKILDKSGLNAEKYKKLYDSMSDEEFNSYMDNFLNDKDHNFYMEILPNKNEPSIYLKFSLF